MKFKRITPWKIKVAKINVQLKILILMNFIFTKLSKSGENLLLKVSRVFYQ